MDKIPTNKGKLSPAEIMDDLLYVSYATNVDESISTGTDIDSAHEKFAKFFNLTVVRANYYRLQWNIEQQMTIKS